MTDEPTTPLTPAQEEEVRRLLAEARHTEPMPPDVVARLDRVLDDLADEPGRARAGRRPRRAAGAGWPRCWSPPPPWSWSGSASARSSTSAAAAPATSLQRRRAAPTPTRRGARRRSSPSRAPEEAAPSDDRADGRSTAARLRARRLFTVQPRPARRATVDRRPDVARRRGAGRLSRPRRRGYRGGRRRLPRRSTGARAASSRSGTASTRPWLVFRRPAGRHPGRRPLPVRRASSPVRSVTLPAP